jgi:hypothetical protein
MFHCDWCKKAVKALKEGKPVKLYHVFLSGPGDVGKSHVIKLIYSDTQVPTRMKRNACVLGLLSKIRSFYTKF